MKLSCENAHVRKIFGDRGAIKALHDAGFDAVDFSCYHLPPEDDVINRPDRREYAAELRDYAESLGMCFNQSHAAFAFKEKEGYDSKNYNDIIRSMEFASCLGAPHIIIHSLKCAKDTDEVRNEKNRNFYRSFLPYCEEYGIKIAVENLFTAVKQDGSWRGRLGTPAEMNAFVDSLESPWFVTCCDLGHAGLTGTPPEEFIAGMSAERLAAIHVQDLDYVKDRHWLPYLGEFNWDAVASSLAGIGYRGDFTFEILHFIDRFPSELIPDALAFAAKVGRSLIAKIDSASKQ